MTDYQQKDGTGALFLNKSKTGDNDNRPDWSGDCTVGTVKYRIGGWEKISKTGTKYLKISFTPDTGKQYKPQSSAPPRAPRPISAEPPEAKNPVDYIPFNDDVPF